MDTKSTSRYRLIMRKPASWWNNRWREALPSGNGMIGAAVYGGAHEETVLLNHSGLWRSGKRAPLPDVSHTLQEARKLMTEGRFAEANRLQADALLASGYSPELPTPLPLGDLGIRMTVGQAFRGYRRMLDMETGEVTVSWRDGEGRVERSLFVSRADDMIVCRIRADAGTVRARMRLSLHDPHESVREPSPDLARHAESQALGDCLVYAARNDDGSDFGAVCRIVASQGRVESAEDGLEASGEGTILLLIKLFVGGERERDWARLREQLSTVESGYEELLDAHIRRHRPLFLSMKLRLGEDDDGMAGQSNEELLLEAYDGKASPRLAEKMWAYGRYLLLSATGEQGNPCTLYGLWGGDYSPIWSQYVANQNVQMMVWHAPAGGLAEQMLSMFAYYEGMLPQFRDNARLLFGARGIYIPAYTAPGHGAPAVLVPVITNWTGAAGWLAQHFYLYYKYTGDETFLRERALPFMREAALFYRDYLTPGPDGLFYSFPSVSPENTPANHVTEEAGHLDHPMPSAANATMDFAIARELLGNLVQGSRIACAHPEELAIWEEMLAGIPPYQINADGALKEWMDPAFDDNYNHRHIAHLYPLFPGTEITARSEPQLFAACRKAVEKRSVVGIGDQSGWSLTNLANLYARLGQGEEALDCLQLLARSCLLDNFYTVHNDWRSMGVTLPFYPAPVQLDANMGWTSAVQEMLLFVSETELRCLPALPADWPVGSVERMRFHAGAIDFAWDRRASAWTVRLDAERAAEFGLELPEWVGECGWEGDGEATAADGDGRRLHIRLEAGQSLQIAAGAERKTKKR